MVKHCAYGTCNSDDRYRDRPHMQGVWFIPFPKPHMDLEKCKRWVNACRRQNFGTENITKDSYVCCKHFVGGNGPTADNPDPVPATATPDKLLKLNRRRKAPTLRSPVPTKRDRHDAAESLILLSNLPDATEGDIEPRTSTNDQQELPPAELTDHLKQCVDKGVQASSNSNIKDKIDNIVLRNQLKLSTAVSQEKGTRESDSYMGFESMRTDRVKFKFYTGLTIASFLCLLDLLGDSINRLRYWGRKTKFTSQTSPSKRRGRSRKLSPIDQLFLTLVKLRRVYPNRDMAYLFGVSHGYISTVFITWIQHLYREFYRIRELMFPPREFYRSKLNKSFRSFKNIRIIIDCTEFFVQMPRNFQRQGNMYSSYKHNHTRKVIIGMSPTGAVSFISDAFEGAISDKELFLQSGLMNLLNPGDLVMADRGFTLSSELMQIGVSLNIPPFLMGRERLTPQEELLTKKIARVRIHVERLIERIKSTGF